MFSQAYDWVSLSTVLITYEKDGISSGAGTGFFLRGLLVTNSHVLHAPNGRDVRFTSPTANESFVTSDKVFYESCIGASEREKFDFAFFDPAFLPKAWQTTFGRLWTPHMRAPQVGDEVGIIGYPFGKPRPTGHRCWITAIYRSNYARVLQLEGSINVANSGGPLFSTHEKAIIGIVTRKESGLSDRFGLLQESLRNRLETLGDNGALGETTNPAVGKALADLNRDLLQIAHELERSSNTGIGYAFSIEHLLEDDRFHARASEDPYGPPLRYWK